MQLEDYFDFLNADNIRIKGYRIGIDLVLEHYLNGYSAEEISAVYPDLNLKKIYTTITYYLSDRPKLDAYLLRVRQWREQRYREWAANPSPLIQRLRAIGTQQNCEAI